MGAVAIGCRIYMKGSIHPEATLPDEILMVEKLANKGEDALLTATFKMVLFDHNSRAAFVKFVQSTDSIAAIIFWEGIQKLRIKAAENSEGNYDDEIKNILYEVYINKVLLTTRLRIELKAIYATFGTTPRGKVLSKLEEAQNIIVKQMNELLPKFERSKGFAEFIQYNSIPPELSVSARNKPSPSSRRPLGTFNEKGSFKDDDLISRMGLDSSASFKGLHRAFSSVFSKSILLVESSTLVAKILISYLQTRKYEVVHAVNQKEALESLVDVNNEFGMVLFSLDINRNGGLGIITQYLELCRRLNKPPIKIFGTISDARSPVMQDALTLGFNAVLVKPFDYNDVIRLIAGGSNAKRSWL
jgi:CheY-like chemotaxis protein